MSVVNTIQFRNKGTLTLPVELRRKYGLSEGDVLTLGAGAFLLYAGASMANRSGDRVAERMAKAGVTLDDILETLDDFLAFNAVSTGWCSFLALRLKISLSPG